LMAGPAVFFALVRRKKVAVALLENRDTPHLLHVALRTACRVDRGLATKWPGRPSKEIFADLTWIIDYQDHKAHRGY
jgi:hypothetical protein